MYAVMVDPEDDAPLRPGRPQDAQKASRLRAVWEAGSSLSPSSWHSKSDTASERGWHYSSSECGDPDETCPPARPTQTRSQGRLHVGPAPFARMSEPGSSEDAGPGPGSSSSSSGALGHCSRTPVRRLSVGKLATRAMGNPFASNPLAAPLAPPHGLMSSSDAASLPSPESDREGSDGGAGAPTEDSATHGGRLARPWHSARAGRLTGGASSRVQSPTRSTASSATQLHTSAAARTRSPQRVAPDPYAPTDSLTSSSGYHWQGHGADPDFLPAPSPAFDIFEPRQAPAGGLEAVIGTPAAALGRLTGHQLLQQLSQGMLVGKTWVRDAVRVPSCTASGRPRSVRHITLTVSQNSEHPVNISYMRKGWHAMMQRQATGSEEVAATAYRAQIKPGAWQGDNTVLLFTNRGCLALQPLTASSYAAWVLGLNLAFAMGTSRLQNHIINRRIRDMPRSPLLMVQGC